MTGKAVARAGEDGGGGAETNVYNIWRWRAKHTTPARHAANGLKGCSGWAVSSH